VSLQNYINVLAIFAVLVMAPEIGFSEAPDRLICENRTLFYGLWKDAAFGRDPNRTEKAAWVILSPGGFYSFQRWPASAARNSEIWMGPAPENAVALVHTHPVIMDEKPSRGDILTAQRLRMALYVISSKGIWSVASNGEKKKQGGPGWRRNGACNLSNLHKARDTNLEIGDCLQRDQTPHAVCNAGLRPGLRPAMDY